MSKEVEKLTPMQEELLSRADSIFATMKEAAMAAKDFAMDQLPDIVHQLIVFERVYLTCIVLAPIILLPLFIALWFKTTKIDAYENDGIIILFGAGTIMLGVSSFLAFISMLANFKSFLMVWFAPKIYLIQYLTELLKKAT